ncbi:hypothetical protein OKW30_006693 [Paraburkholderia sp. Clong3]|uniref:hypothetical protein n=1 Tax=unclassified Paraburkholderia TaxID=2615204 RepID=UPI00160C7774|nr:MULTISPECIES: hypothetical protein [unclassified Paraburkholderia]MBB5464107.1 hypothetical protein [Paraburkholderia sp. CI2]MBC8741487.1 hypothetical protein [Paraburkholderia sp. UCT31]
MLLTLGKAGCKWTLRVTGPVTGKRRDAGPACLPRSLLRTHVKALAMGRSIDAGKHSINECDREQEAASVAAAALPFQNAAHALPSELRPSDAEKY